MAASNASNASAGTETHSLQLWPGGRSVTFRETYNRLRCHSGYQIRTEAKRWRRASETEAKEIRVEVLARAYSERDILCRDSSLVDDLLKHGPDLPGDLGEEWQVENIANLIPDPSDWDIEECREWLEEHGHNRLDRAIYQLDEESDVDDWRQLVQDNAEPAEIFEWWRVTGWLAPNLQEIGEPVLSNAYGDWWGRCTTGQGYLMDGTLQAVARRFV